MNKNELTGTEKFISSFRDFYAGNNGGAVLISGEAGSGKSTIISALRLMPEISDSSAVCAFLDFTISVNTDSELGLSSMRTDLIKHFKIDFSFFDTTYVQYLARTNPDKKFDSDFDLFANSKILNEVLGVTGAKGSEFADRLYYTVERGKPAVTNWWDNNGGAIFTKLNEDTAESMRKSLPQQWAKDVRLALNGRKCVIIIDSFENIYEHKTSAEGSDKWIKDLMENLPEAFFIFSGRVLPETDPAKTLHLEAGKFDKEETNNVLRQYGLVDKKLGEAVFDSTRGDKMLTVFLAYGLAQNSKDSGKKPKPDDVEYGAKEIMLFLNSSLGSVQADITRVVSATRFFGKEVFEFLQNEFLQNSSHVSYSDYCLLPAVSTSVSRYFSALRKPFREEIYASLASDVKDNLHFTLFNYYLKKLDSYKGTFKAYRFYQDFSECFYHAKSALDGEGFADWFQDAFKKYFSKDKLGFWISLHNEAVSYIRDLMGLLNPYTAISMEKLALLYTSIEDYAQAEVLLKRTLNISEKLGGEESRDAVRGRNRLAEMYTAKGDYKSALQAVSKNAELKTDLEGADHPDTLKYIQKMAVLAMKDKDYVKASEFGEQSLELHIQKLGKENSSTLKVMGELAEIQEAAGNLQRAEELYTELLDIREKALGGQHPETAKSISQLAFYFYRKGDYDSAEPLFYRALEAKEAQYGDSHPLVAAYCNNLGFICYRKGKLDRAETMYEKSLKIKEKNFGVTHPATITGMSNLAALLFKKGDLKEAEDIFRKVMEQSVITFGEDSLEVAAEMTNLACVISMQGDIDQAEALNKNALSIIERQGEETEETAVSLNNMGELLYRKGAYDAAADILEKALSVAESVLGEKHPVTSKINSNLTKVRDKIH